MDSPAIYLATTVQNTIVSFCESDRLIKASGQESLEPKQRQSEEEDTLLLHVKTRINFNFYFLTALLEESEDTASDKPAEVQVNRCYLLL